MRWEKQQCSIHCNMNCILHNRVNSCTTGPKGGVGTADAYRMLILYSVCAVFHVSSAPRCGCQRGASHFPVEFGKVLPVSSKLRHHRVPER